MMRRLAPFVLAAAAIAMVAPLGSARADKPEVGKPWLFPTLKDWLEGTPVGTDSAGKVVVHWFCKPKSEDCRTDLSRIYNMREQGNVYVIAYINGTKRDALKLDPVRGEVGAGAVAFGKPVAALVKRLGLSPAAMPMSVVVDVDGKVALITYTGDPDQLDLRDKQVAALVDAIKVFTVTTTGPTAAVTKGVPFTLTLSAELAPWLAFDSSLMPEIKLTVPPDITCDSKVVPAKIAGKKLTAEVACKGAVKGSYEATGALRFRYQGPNKAVGLGQDAVRWKFVVSP